MDAHWSCWTPICRRRISWTLIEVAGLLFAVDEYHGRLLELLDSHSPRRIPWTLIGVAGLLFSDDEYHGRSLELLDSLFADDEYHGRLLELLDSYSPTTNTMDAYWSCWIPIR